MPERMRPKGPVIGFRPAGKPIPVDETGTKKERAAVKLLRAKSLVVKAVYTQERRRWETMRTGEISDYYPGKRYDGAADIEDTGGAVRKVGRPNAWLKIISWCEKRNIRPDVFVRVCFADLSLNRTPPEPPQICGPTYEKKWHQTIGTIDARLRTALRTQKEYATLRLTYWQRVANRSTTDSYLLTFSDAELSPLFRYCMLKNVERARLREAIRVATPDAVLQFECYRDAYMREWASVIPAGFPEFSEKLYPGVLAKLGHNLRPDDPQER